MGKRYIAEDGSPAERRMHLFRIPWRRGRVRTAASLGDSLFQWLSGGVAVAVVGSLALIVAVLFVLADESIRTFGVGFLNGTTWNPVPPEVFGAVPFVYGTLVTSALALLFGVPISLGIPIFQGNPIGTDKFTAGVILAVMIIPTISSVSRESLLAVPQSQREAALSLGATHWETTRVAVLRYARAGLFGAVILGLGRAVGETMAVTMTIGNRNAISVSLFDQGQTIASWIANNFTEAGPLELSALIELGLVLMLMSLAINIFARLMVRRVMGVGGAAGCRRSVPGSSPSPRERAESGTRFKARSSSSP